MNSIKTTFSTFISDVATLRLRKKSVLAFYLALGLALIYVLIISGSAAVAPQPVATVPEVKVATVRNLLSDNSFQAVGVVSAVSEARLQTESGGRITAVNVALGDTVTAGTIIARLENASESAVLLQAQGAYEAALAGALGGNLGVDQAETALLSAKNAAVSTERAAYTTVSAAFYTNLNKIFDDQIIDSPNLILSGSEIPYLQNEGREFEKVLTDWQRQSAQLSVSGNLESSLASAQQITTRAIAVVDALIRVLNNQSDEKIVAGAPVSTNIAQLTALRATLNGTVASLKSATVGLDDARDMKSRADIGGTDTQVSGANAQVKIALGSLRAAQANFAKTLVRTPITGVVNALYLKAGEYTNPGTPAAIVANNGSGLEIATAVSQEDSVKLAIGDVVTIDASATGTISAIAGAIDPTTGKVALKISIAESSTLQNGSTVAVSFTTDTSKEITEIVIPLSSVKMTGTGPVVFKVNGEKLAALPITLGAISGENVVVIEGITADNSIVVDARGLKAGEVVTVAK